MRNLIVILSLLAMGLFALTDFLGALLILFFVSALPGIFALRAAWSREYRERHLRTGRLLLGLLFGLSLASFSASLGDAQHMLWNVQLPLLGLLFGSGVLLIGIWEHAPMSRAINKFGLALGGALVLCAVPIIHMSAFPLGSTQIAGSLVPALFEVAEYGFDGELPAQMQPVSALQIERNLGHPPREITVAMGATFAAAVCWILFGCIALIGRVLPSGSGRSLIMALLPMIVASVCFFWFGAQIGAATWRNEPLLVQLYGPTMLGAVVTGLVLFGAYAGKRSILRGHVEVSSPSCSPAIEL